MTILDWSIVGVFLVFIVWTGIHSMKYVRGVTDFLACGRVCGRYVISVADAANCLAVVVMIGAVESGYRSGSAYGFWGSLTLPVGMFLSLTGFAVYRFRQTKAMSFGQFMEMRYSRGLRVFASTLRSVSEMLANMILPALAGRFFVCFLGLPETFSVFGVRISVFELVMFVCLALAISMILFGGSVTLVITDTVQGLIAYPLLTLFVVFVLFRFSWTEEIVPVMLDRAKGESFLNPYDVENLRDFNLFYIFFLLFSNVMSRGIGLGAGGGTSAARSPHEQKMAGVLGTWRGGFMTLFYLLLVFAVVAFMNHANFAGEAAETRAELSVIVTKSLVGDPTIREKILRKTEAVEPRVHVIGRDKPLSMEENMDTPYLDAFVSAAKENPESGLEGKVPEFRTLYHQMMLPAVLRKILPPGMAGLFCMLVLLMIISTDDSRIFSASLTLSQDLVLPLMKKPPTPETHIRIIRLVTVGVGVFFFFGSLFMSQLEYVNLFILIMYGIWSAGAGIVVLGGLYTRFGTTAGAWAALLSGAGLMAGGVAVQRNWASTVYPLLERMNWAEGTGAVLETVSRPFHPYLVWRMDPFRCPVNAVELCFLATVLSIAMYVLVSKLSAPPEPFNLDRMLHRGKYNTDGFREDTERLSFRNFFSRAIGITKEYTRGDRIIAWSVFLYSFGFGFCLFLGIVIWNSFSRWGNAAWANYYFAVNLAMPFAIGCVTTVWFFTGGVIDLRRMLKDLKKEKINVLDNGVVVGGMSLADKTILEAADKKTEEKDS